AHPGLINWPSLAVGLLAMGLVFIGDRSRYQRYSYAIALVAVTALVAVLSPQTVALVGDATAVPRTFVSFHLPELSFVPRLIGPALAIAIIVVVQGSGVSQSVPNPDGEYPDANGDFRGQGLGNLAAGLGGGIPVGGSLGGTAMIMQLGSKSRWANVFAGLFTLVAVLTIGPLIELIPLPALAGLLVMVGISMINTGRLLTVYNTGTFSVFIMVVTFVATLFLPIQYAVGLGVVLHIVLYVFSSSEEVRIERLVRRPDGALAEAEVPDKLESEQVLILYPVGSLFFAGAAELEENLPDTADATRSVVILSLRDRDEVGSTFVRVLTRYAQELEGQGNKLKLTGLSERVVEQLQRTGLGDALGAEDIYPARDTFGAALAQAEEDAWEWIGKEAPSAVRPVMVRVPVAEWEAGLAWYEKAFPQAKRVEQASGFIALDIGGIALEVVDADEQSPSGAAGSVVYWRTADLEARLAALEALGATLYRGPLEVEDGRRMCQVLDPWGNALGVREE
ncbi:MAG: SulP family inorganic anion transporter, partial [Candidatus Promineifilaceae bacterium]